MTFEPKRADEPEAWQFELSGEAARRELSGFTVRRGLNTSFEPKRGPKFELSGKAARRGLK